MTLLAELRRLLRLVDPMPPRVLRDAEAAGLLLRTPATEFLVPHREAVPACRTGGRRVRVATADGDTVLVVEVRELGSATRVAGLAPGVRLSHGGARIDVDHAGYFNADLPAGPVRLTVTWPDGRRGDVEV
jgi:hypothetical protein